ncbi:MAG TPA: Stk1 family PASTA domain-containing Ser/Thr kinase [Actinocrinis sp.]|nr:Stk1 family PASTA domain-containing Ser/Thr kinase [Actinocrinis sp.]
MEEPRRLGNRYELGAVLGRGGMAEVFMARDIRLGRTVAVKTLRADMARDATFQARFRREAQSAASLNHPAVVAVYDTGEDYIGGISLPYIVMEYVDGSTLRDLLHSGRRLLPERAMEITSGVLQALDYSHRNGIVHRDIKPANIMLNRAGAVKVMDFGIAKGMGDVGMTMTQTSAVIGTAQYLSPEQAKGETVDARSDLYSTGCLLYELLTGRPPFIGDSPVAVAYQHVRESPQAPSYYDPEVPAVADAIVLKALGKHPDERYQSADEMRADLERALDGRPIAAGPVAAYGGNNTPTQVVPNYGGGYGNTSQSTVGQATPPTRYQPSYQSPAYGNDPDVDPVPRQRRVDESSRNKKSNDKTAFVVIGVIGVILIVLAVIVYKTVFNSPTDTGVQVPNIVNLTVQDATSQLQNVGLKLGAVDCGGATSTSKTVNAGSIISQSPAQNATAQSGSAVSYCLSTGYPTATLFSSITPGQTYQTVSTTLTNAQFTSVTEKQVTNKAAVGTVLDVQNSANQSELGQTIPLNTPLLVVVSSGPGTVTVPSVVNQNCTSALNSISGDNLVGSQTFANSNSVPNGSVISTSPSGGSTVGIGSTVTVTCSSGPSQVAPTTAPATTTPATPNQ